MKIDRQKVHNKYGGHCAYCGREITIEEMQVDHFFPQYLDKKNGNNPNNDISNLMPSCRECNRYKCTESIETIRRYLENTKQKLLKTQNLRILNRLGGFYISEKPIKFYFETFINN